MIAKPSVRRLRLPRQRTRSRYSRPRQSHRRDRIWSGSQSRNSIRNLRRHKRARRTTDHGNSRSEKWELAYIKRIDATIAALKSAGVPVIWVGLPSQRGTNASAESSYLNELYRSQAEKAGIVYVDIWDGFVDEAGKFSPQGPDYLGQTRRLRTGDGVYFTKFGARKLAHYVEREIERIVGKRACRSRCRCRSVRARKRRMPKRAVRRNGRQPGRSCRSRKRALRRKNCSGAAAKLLLLPPARR